MATDPERIDVRFSLRALLVIFLCLAVGCALLFSTPNYIAVAALIFLNVALPAGLTMGAIYTRNTWRAFCIGGLFPSGLMLYTTGWVLGLSLFEGPGRIRSIPEWAQFSDAIAVQYRIYVACSWVMTVLIGTMAVLIRYYARKYRT